MKYFLMPQSVTVPQNNPEVRTESVFLTEGEFFTGRMKVNLRRFEDLKIRLKKSLKMKHLHEGISRTDL